MAAQLSSMAADDGKSVQKMCNRHSVFGTSGT